MVVMHSGDCPAATAGRQIAGQQAVAAAASADADQEPGGGQPSPTACQV